MVFYEKALKKPTPAIKSVPTEQTASDRINTAKNPIGMKESKADARSQPVGFRAHLPVSKSRYSIYRLPGWYLLRDI